jgi:hypothetical protein
MVWSTWVVSATIKEQIGHWNQADIKQTHGLIIMGEEQQHKCSVLQP